MTLLEAARHHQDDLVALRRDLHRHPELGLHLPRTQERVLAEVDQLPVEVLTGTGTTSVTGVLRGGRRQQDAPAVLLRADMDALPVVEATGLDYAASRDAMHACGHDLHTAMLVGAARILAEHRSELPGDVVLMFQPGEEGWDGAGVMLDEGVLDVTGRRVDAAYALHVFSALEPAGRFVTRPGVILSASARLRVTVRGAGGHGSTPHLAADPVTAVAEMVTALQTMVTRQFDAFDPVIVTVGELHAGTQANVIPDTASLAATVRTFSEASRERFERAAPRLLHGIAAAHGVEVDVDVVDEYPVTRTDADETSFAVDTVVDLFGDERHLTLPQPLGGSEDFSRVLQQVPGSFVGLGATPVDLDPTTAPFNHSPHARFDDGVLADGAAVYAELASRRLAALAAAS